MPDFKIHYASSSWLLLLLLSPLAWAEPVPATRTDNASIQSTEWRDDSSPAQTEIPDTVVNDADVWQRIRSGFRFADTQNPLTAVHESWYAARPDYVKRMVERSRRYLFHIATEVERRNMPMEIALLLMIESAFNPKAYSPSAASGIWQFIPSTGRHYGLKQDSWYDGRRDITAATNAALDYLGKLYLDFGDWSLALAAYNCGEGCVSRAIQKNLQQGLPTDYASLPLPTETRHYVPKLLAIKNLVLDPQRFGVAIDVLPNQPYFAQVAVRSGMDVRSAARLASMSMDEFSALNPAFQRNLIRSDTPINILVPVDKTDRFVHNLQNGTWDTWKPYTAKKGERIDAIAKRFDTSVMRLKEHNSFNLKRGKLARSQTILIPTKGRGAVADQSDRLEPNTSPDSNLHTVVAGETLYSIAHRYHLTVSALTLANPEIKRAVHAGQELVLPLDTEASSASEPALKKVAFTSRTKSSEHRRTYTIKRGDTLSSIARHFDVSVSDLKSWNKTLQKSGNIQPGKRIVLRAN